MKKSTKLLLLTALCTSMIAPAIAKTKVPYDNQGFYSDADTQIAVNFVSTETIKDSLKGQAPITVSFDIDDTSLFSSTYFHYGFTFGEELGFGSTPKEVLHSQKFWDYIADQSDKSSLPKKATKKLIAMHLERGDKIVFITGRTKHSKSQNGVVNETAKVLQKYFKLPKPSVIWYTADTAIEGYKFDKTAYIKKVGASIHYGDSDNDILAAKEAGIRGIRVQRSPSSTNPQKLNGGYGEEVLINSAW